MGSVIPYFFPSSIAAIIGGTPTEEDGVQKTTLSWSATSQKVYPGTIIIPAR